MRSTEQIEQNPSGERMIEGWSTASVKEVKYILTKKDEEYIVVKLEDGEGRAALDFLSDTREDGSRRIVQLAKIAGVSWGEGATGEEVADMLQSNLFTVDAEITWAKGDKCFVKGYAAPQGTRPSVAQQPQPQAHQAQSAPPAKRTGRF